MSTLSDHSFLMRTLELAEKGRGFCAPNPSVGAIVVHRDKIIGEGFHEGVGLAHAEVQALSQFNPIKDTKGATLYVSLEPCCHWGRTPPCTELIIHKGIQRVVFAQLDPNPLVSGKGKLKLEEAGIVCEHLPISVISEFYESYVRFVQQKSSTFTAKIAMSLNGKIGGTGQPRIFLTQEKISIFTHQCRKKSDAILTSANTIISDDPQLNVRLPEETMTKPVIILDRTLKCDPGFKVFQNPLKTYLFYDASFENTKVLQFEKLGITCIPFIQKNTETLSLMEIAKACGKLGFHDIWIEAGGRLVQSFLEQNLLKRLYVYVAPLWLEQNDRVAFQKAGLLDRKKNIQWKVFGQDVCCEFTFE